MKNFSDFKKRIKPGVKLHAIFHQSPNGRDEKGKLILTDEDKGTREIKTVQTNAFTLLTPKKDGSGIVESWLHYPKASECKILSENSILILSEDFRLHNPERKSTPLIPLITYTFIE